MRRLAKTPVFFSLLLIYTALSLVTFRPGTCRCDDTVEARVAFERAVGLFSDEDYRGALAGFEESYRLYHRVSTLFNIGMCRKALFLYMEAIDTFEEFLANEESENHPVLREHTRSALVELAQLIGELRIKDIPEDSIVELDGKPVSDLGSEGSVGLNPGHHSIKVTKGGYKEFRTDSPAPNPAELSTKVQFVISVTTEFPSAEANPPPL